MLVGLGDNEQEVDVEGVIHYTVDKYYGADADGNRRSKMIEIEKVTNMAIYDCGVEIKFDTLPLMVSKYQAEEALIEKFFDEGDTY